MTHFPPYLGQMVVKQEPPLLLDWRCDVSGENSGPLNGDLLLHLSVPLQPVPGSPLCETQTRGSSAPNIWLQRIVQSYQSLVTEIYGLFSYHASLSLTILRFVFSILSDNTQISLSALKQEIKMLYMKRIVPIS